MEEGKEVGDGMAGRLPAIGDGGKAAIFASLKAHNLKVHMQGTYCKIHFNAFAKAYCLFLTPS